MSAPVLVAVVGSPQVSDIERTLGRLGPDAEVTLLSVVPPLPAAQADLRVPRIDRSLADLLVDGRIHWLEECISRLTRPVECLVRSGGEVRTIVSEAVSGGYETVAVVGDTTPGSRLTLARLIELCPGSLLVEAPGVGDIRPDVVAAIDPDSDLTLNRSIIVAAAAEAKDRGGVLHLVHAWQLAGGEGMLRRSDSELTGPDIAQVAELVRLAHHNAFTDVVEVVLSELDRAALPPVEHHLIEGTVRDAVRRVVELDHVGLAVLGTQGRVAIERALGGSDARQVADTTAYATLILKPAGFVSPLTSME